MLLIFKFVFLIGLLSSDKGGHGDGGGFGGVRISCLRRYHVI